MKTDPQILARLDALGEILSARYHEEVAQKLRADPHTAWFAPTDNLPDEGKPVFFMTKEGHWAGERLGDDWCDWGDKGTICDVEAVVCWQYAPEIERASAR